MSPVYMLNVLWFKPDGGAQKYQEYVQAATPLVAKYGAKSSGPPLMPQQALIGEFDADLVLIVEWPSMKAFQQFAADPDYQPFRTIREAAISNSLLVQCVAPPS